LNSIEIKGLSMISKINQPGKFKYPPFRL